MSAESAGQLASRFDELAVGSGGPAGGSPPSSAVTVACTAMAHLLRRTRALEVGPQSLATLHRHIMATEHCSPKDGASQ